AFAPLSAVAYTDTTSPTVGAVSPTSAVAGASVAYSAAYSDDLGVTLCQLTDGATSYSPMTLSGGTASYSVALSVGSHNLQAQCRDAVGHWGYGAATMVTVSTAGTVSAVSPTTAVSGVATTFSVTYSTFNAPYTAHGCWLVVDGSTVYPEMSISGDADSVSGTASKSHTFTTLGTHIMRVSCLETTGGAYKIGPDTTITVSAPDTTAPTVNQIDQSAATAGTALTLTAIATDNVGISSCSLYVGGVSQGTMTVSGGVASRSHTFSAAGSYVAVVRCTDAAGLIGTGASRTVVVSAAADIDKPVINLVAQTTATAGIALSLTAIVSDNVGISSCTLYIGGVSQGAMTVSGGAASRSHT
ncbi:MAG: hypothetical protein AAB368_02555, partial [bacterium]